MKTIQEIELADQNALREKYRELKDKEDFTENEQYEFNSVESELVKRFLGGTI